MSNTLNLLIAPLKECDPNEARRLWGEITSENPDIAESAKGTDIGQFVVRGLIGQGKRPDHPPIFSISEFKKLEESFLTEFGAKTLGEISDSVPVLVSGCSVHLEEVHHYGDLSERERGLVMLKLPAVRVHFVPEVI